jgi:hypothetical protein
MATLIRGHPSGRKADEAVLNTVKYKPDKSGLNIKEK